MVRIRKIPQTGLRIKAEMQTPQRVLVTSLDRPTSAQTMRLDMPEMLGGTNKGLMPLEALVAAYAGSLNVVGNFVAKTMEFDLRNWELTVWAEFDPRGIWGLAKVPKPIKVMHVEGLVSTSESPKRLAQLRKTAAERCPVHNLLKSAGVRFKEKWEIVPPNGAVPLGEKKSRSKK